MKKLGVVKFESVIPEIKTDLQSISSKIEDRTERNNFNQFFSGGGIPSVSASNYSESNKKKDGSLGNESYVGTGGILGATFWFLKTHLLEISLLVILVILAKVLSKRIGRRKKKATTRVQECS